MSKSTLISLDALSSTAPWRRDDELWPHLPLSLPRVPRGHLFETDAGHHLLVADGSRLYNLSEALASRLETAMQGRDEGAVDSLLMEWGIAAGPDMDLSLPADFPVRALSLAVAQKCNLGCTYCYAREGDFGATPSQMSLDVALKSVERLLFGAGPGEVANLAFLGGEPLVNRPVIHAATEAAVRQAHDKGVKLGLSITTNGTLLTEEDADFFERHGFAITVSLDGVGEVHDNLRSYKNGRGSYAVILERVRPLLARQQAMQVSARVTVTPENLNLRETLEEFIQLGFHSVGFSPMLHSPTGRAEMGAHPLAKMLAAMEECGHEFERRTALGERYPFANLATALQQIHRGTHRPYPCGAGAGYMAVSAAGDLSACHRFVEDEKGAMGDLAHGIDSHKRTQWLQDRHVHRQEPCSGCWARYLCGGGCHHEVLGVGRNACHYIRGWLHYSLQAYARLSVTAPHLFEQPNLSRVAPGVLDLSTEGAPAAR